MSTEEKPEEIWIDQPKIENTDYYKYRGRVISFKNRMDREIKLRVGNAWKAFWSLKFESRMSVVNKTKMFKSAIMPVLVYGAQA